MQQERPSQRGGGTRNNSKPRRKEKRKTLEEEEEEKECTVVSSRALGQRRLKAILTDFHLSKERERPKVGSVEGGNNISSEKRAFDVAGQERSTWSYTCYFAPISTLHKGGPVSEAERPTPTPAHASLHFHESRQNERERKEEEARRGGERCFGPGPTLYSIFKATPAAADERVCGVGEEEDSIRNIRERKGGGIAMTTTHEEGGGRGRRGEEEEEEGRGIGGGGLPTSPTFFGGGEGLDYTDGVGARRRGQQQHSPPSSGLSEWIEGRQRAFRDFERSFQPTPSSAVPPEPLFLLSRRPTATATEAIQPALQQQDDILPPFEQEIGGGGGGRIVGYIPGEGNRYC